MSTGRELERTVTCGYWKTHVESHKQFLGYKIYDRNKKLITPREALTQTFCSLRVRFKPEVDKDYIKLMAAFLNMLADSRSEHMYVEVKRQSKAYWEIRIS